MQNADGQTRGVTAFETYLRTGRRPGRGVIERKFNPWHDPDDGRFTFARQGRYFQSGGGGARRQYAEARELASPRDISNASTPRARDTQDQYRQHDPQNPRNHGIYVVRKGDSLTRIAAMRKGLSVADLEWLNGISASRPLRIGQRLKLPHQEFLDSGKRAYDKFLALNYYARTHGGRLPPNPANPPSIESQILDRDWRQEIRGSYNYYIDVGSRFRRVFGVATLAETPKRSRKSQREVPEKGPGDDGGHYIAPRFNGPTDWFNHFAQDLHINRGAYRVMEDGWYKEAATGKKVFISITPFYVGASKRPSSVEVRWAINGREYSREFPNEATERENGKR